MGTSALLPPPGQPTEGPDSTFKTAAVPNIVTFAFQKIGPPSPIYIQRDDRLHVKIQNSLAGVTPTLSARLLLPVGPEPGQPDNPAQDASVTAQQARGFILPIVQVFTPTSDRTPNEFDIPLAEGYLLSVVIGFGSGTPPPRGATFITVGLQRGAATGIRHQNLISDNGADNLDLAWPGGSIRYSSEGPGWRHSIQQANPGVGLDWTFTAATKQRLSFVSLVAQLVAANAGVARAVELIVDDGVNVVFRIPANATQAINTTAQYVAGSLGTPSTIVTTDLQINTPPGLFLLPGWRMRTNTVGINAADQWSNIWLNVEEWIAT